MVSIMYLGLLIVLLSSALHFPGLTLPWALGVLGHVYV